MEEEVVEDVVVAVAVAAPHLLRRPLGLAARRLERLPRLGPLPRRASSRLLKGLGVLRRPIVRLAELRIDIAELPLLHTHRRAAAAAAAVAAVGLRRRRRRARDVAVGKGAGGEEPDRPELLAVERWRACGSGPVQLAARGRVPSARGRGRRGGPSSDALHGASPSAARRRRRPASADRLRRRRRRGTGDADGSI